MITKYAQPLQ